MLQEDIISLQSWADSNNIAFNGLKFQCLKYGSREAIKTEYNYMQGDFDEVIEDVSNTRDLGIIMSSSGDFTDQVNLIVKRAKKRAGWIHRSFLKNDREFLKRIWKTYIKSMMDFGSQVWCPVDPSNIMNLESVLRHYTERVQGMGSMSYWERLKSLKMNSIQRRFERYRIIYIWQILNGNVPNFGITFSKNVRRGMMVNILVLNSKVKASVKTLRDQSLLVHGGRMFNLLP